jgi:hypothetical protein
MSQKAGEISPGIYNVVVSETQAVPLKYGRGMRVRLCFDIVMPRLSVMDLSMSWIIRGLESFEDLKWNFSQLGVELDRYDGITAACIDVVDRAAFAFIDSRRKVRLLHEDTAPVPLTPFWNRIGRVEAQALYAELGLEQFMGRTNELDKCGHWPDSGTAPPHIPQFAPSPTRRP